MKTGVVRLAGLVWAAVALCACLLGAALPRVRLVGAAAGPAATGPAAAPASQPAYPSAALAAACGRKADELRRAEPNMVVLVEPPFVIAGDMGEAQLRRHAAGSVLRPARAMWASYFARKPARPVRILLFDGRDSYARFAKGDYPGGDFPYFGYYSHADERMVMNIQTGGGTLVHELTHALIAWDFPAVPSWFNEGLASLHEQCMVGERGIAGLTNWRLPALQKAIASGKLRPLRELVSRRDFYGQQSGLNYAQARYFCMYMQERGLLGKFYRHFRGSSGGADADVRAVEHVFGRKIEQVEGDFLAWVKTLRWEG